MPSSARPLASVQEMLPLEEILGDVLCLRGGDCRGVLEAQSVNFALKSEAEQEAIMAGYRAFLNSLSYPLQVLVRILPTDVEVYLAGLRERFGGRAEKALLRLALDHETFVRRLARERTLLERRFYVIFPAGLDGVFERRGMRWPWQTTRNGTQRNGEAAAGQLAFRCGEIAQGLASFGVITRRLNGEELAMLWSDCLRREFAPPFMEARSRPVVLAAKQEEVVSRV